ncbi:2-hydroxyacid dehydrogenase [Maritalea porphyrae]|uniref:2-hydroxyacid dehydrogenase n=1 Tax=Maritalea porphyrae TaxID=880732 RepID=UPI0022AF646D|nr:D-glycerate dehydrogenase [Maritalea porphyrae]MCZ4272171.1 D-glycerate dehydrogenase [Maritalea porphyrae]
MTGSTAKIFVTRRLPALIEERMAALFDTHFIGEDRPQTSEELIAQSQDCDILVSTITDQLNAEVIGALGKNVRMIAQFGNGVDNVDVNAASARGITVTNTPSVLTDDTADMAMALILAVPRRLIEGSQTLLKDGTWPGWSPNWMLGRRLAGKRLGIVGLGRIGMAVARRARAFGLEIHYFGRSRKPGVVEEELDAHYWDNLDEMLSAVDIVTLHTPSTEKTRNIINKERLALMKDDAYLVNLARPNLIDEKALIEAVQLGEISGAALDVFEHHKVINPALLDLARQDKIVLTAHMGSATLEGRIEMGETVIVNMRAFLDGHQPPHRVLPDRLG